MSNEYKRGDKYLVKKLKPRTTNSAKKLEFLKAKVRTCFQLIKLKRKIEAKTCF
jgi:hypothetical protein